MKLTRVMKKKYIANGGSKCPYCQSRNMSGAKLNTGSTNYWQLITCEECGKEWTDMYTLVDIEEI